MQKDSPTVFVGMSGGVDSSVTALLLKEAGYTVVGAFIRGWYPPFLTCTWKEDRRDAMRVAAELGIDFVTINAEDVYKDQVVEYLINEYRHGRTPNPDVMCNKYVKFGVFYERTRELGADYIATGHYARNAVCSQGTKTIAQAKDYNKDQTYFLWPLTEDVRDHALFPLGDMTKSEVREKAHRYGLVTADKRDSQGVCFLGEISMKEFLAQYISSEEGDVLDTDGRVIGRHPGALFFTLGERRGFTITEKTPHDRPRFVVKKDLSHNTITVSERDAQLTEQFSKTEYALTDVNWMCEVTDGEELEARFRHHGKLLPVTVSNADENNVRVHFKEPQTTLAAGQSVVLYRGENCVGGGICDMLVE